MRILIAEDNPSWRETTGYLLNQWGYEFDIACNGRAVVDLSKRNQGKYDLCMMDINMPIMDGCEAAQIIRRETGYFPILAMSMDPGNEKACLEAGMDDFLEKTYTFDELYYKISELTIKSTSVEIKNHDLYMRKEMPLNPDELRELRELDKKGLAKFSLVNTGYKFVVHKNLQNKISHDFIAKGKKLSEFLDRSEEDPGIIHLYRENLHANKRHILPDYFEQLAIKEDEDLKAFTTKAEYPEKEISESEEA